MLVKTHVALSLFFIMLLWNSVTDKIMFAILFLFSTILPDIDSSTAYINRKIKPLSKISNFLTKHRGALHSITLCIIFTIIAVLVSQKFALPFFLGYSLHILADSFTVAGVRAFWPSNRSIKGFIRTGGLAESILLYLVIIANIILFAALIK